MTNINTQLLSIVYQPARSLEDDIMIIENHDNDMGNYDNRFHHIQQQNIPLPTAELE